MVNPGSGSVVYPIHNDPPPSAPDPISSAQHSSTSIYIFLRAILWIVEHIDLFKILIDHLT